ncbi:MAG TPA: hypothetical protein VGG94_00110 [Chthoniobacterales bacterium]
MSLMPSESAHFSDLVGCGLDASKKSKWRVPVPEHAAPEEDVSSRVDPVTHFPMTETSQEPFGQSWEQVQQPAPESPASQWEGAPVLPAAAEPVQDPFGQSWEQLQQRAPELPVNQSEQLQQPALESPPASQWEEAPVFPAAEAVQDPFGQSLESLQQPAPESLPASQWEEAPVFPATEAVQEPFIQSLEQVQQPAPESPANQWDGAPESLSGPVGSFFAQPMPEAAFENTYPTAQKFEAMPSLPLDANAILAALAGAPSATPLPFAAEPTPAAPPFVAPEPRPIVPEPRLVTTEPKLVAPEPRPPMHFQPAASAQDPEEFGFPQPAVAWPSLVRRRRNRRIRFISYEVVALAILVVSAVMGLAHRLPDDPLSLVTKIVTIASAVTVVGIPILFYGLPDTLPTNDR